jgi:hypothetical protein
MDLFSPRCRRALAGVAITSLAFGVAGPIATASADLNADQVASIAAVDSLSNYLDQQLGGASLPTDLQQQQQLAQQLVGSGVLPGASTGEVTALLQAIVAGAPGASMDTVAQLLAGLVGTGVSPGVVTSLLGVHNALDPEGTAQLVAALQAGAPPTGTLLGPVATELQQAAQTPGLPADAVATLNGLAAQIQAAGTGLVPDAVLDQLNGVLALLGSVSNLPGQLLSTVLTLLGPGKTTAGAGGATTNGGSNTVLVPVYIPIAVPSYKLTLQVRKVKLARGGRSAAVSVRSNAPVALPVTLTAKLGKRRAAPIVKLTLRPKKDVVKKVRLSRAARAVLRRGGRLVVTPGYAVPGLKKYPGVTIAVKSGAARVVR